MLVVVADAVICYRPPRERMRERERTSVSRTDDGDSDSLSGRRGSRYPDSHQLFVGNLPHNITERELRTYFESKYSLLRFVFLGFFV